MKKNLSLILTATALVLLGGSVIGSARAALTYYSEDYVAQMDVKSIGVSLNENGAAVSWRDYLHKDDAWNENTGKLLENMLAKDEKLILNKPYKEELGVTNSGTIDEYVRVIVNRYWVDTDKEGNATENKRPDMDPAAIQINFLKDNGWIIDESASTPERTVLYYNKILKSGETSALFADTLSIDNSIMNTVTTETKEKNGYTTTTSSYFYDHVKFVVEAEVDAVQTHNAEDAIKSAWGVNVKIADDGSLNLK